MHKKVNAFLKRIFKTENIRKNLLFLVLLMILMGIILIYSLRAGHYVDFYPTNGTFQNYNPVKRFLNGQIPYCDFTDYLGLGHLYFGSIMTWILGGSFKASLVAFTFLSVLSFALVAFVIAYCFMGDKLLSISMTILIVILDIARPIFGHDSKVFTDTILSAFNASLGPGNSARFIRSMVLPLSIIVFLIIWKWINNKTVIIKGVSNKYVYSSVIGIVGGLSFLWSNDYGISCFVCLIVMTAWVSFAKYRNIITTILCMVAEMLSSIISIVVFATLLSLGNFSNWFSFISGSGGYQMWYYNVENVSCYIFDIELGIYPLIQAALCITYLILILKNSKDKNLMFKYSILAYLNMTCFCAVNEYKLISSGELYGYANVVLILTIVFELISLMNIHFAKYNMHIVLSSVILGFMLIINIGRDEFRFNYLTEKDGVYIEKLDGYIRDFSDDLLSTNHFLQGKKVFATYSTAQDVMNDNYQPSGTDYIIHVLGDESREKYLESFAGHNFDYVSTINRSYNIWEIWVERANWFFYRELYKKWHPIYCNSYEIYWEMNNDGDNCIPFEGNISVDNISENKAIIKIECDDSIDGIADVYIDYMVKKGESAFSKLAFKTLLSVKDISDDNMTAEFFYTNNLRPTGAEYIPVRIINGIGQVELTSVPEKCTNITINDAKIDNIYPVLQQYIEVNSIKEDDEGGYYIKANNNGHYNESMLDKISAVAINGNEYQVNKSDLSDAKIYLYLEDLSNDEVDRLNEYFRNESNIIRFY